MVLHTVACPRGRKLSRLLRAVRQFSFCVAFLLYLLLKPAAAQPSFSYIPGSLVQLSVGADGTVWGINTSKQIYTYNSGTNSWTYIPGALIQVAVGSGTAVRGVNESQLIYQWDASQSKWINVPGALTQIAVGSDGDVWGVNYQSSVYHYDSQTGSFGQVRGSLARLVVGSSGAVYGLNAAGGIYWYNPGNNAFEPLSQIIGFNQIAVGSDGDFWATRDDIAYHFNPAYDRLDSTQGNITQVAVGYGAAVFGLDSAGDIFEWNDGSQSWIQIPGTLGAIAVGGNGAVWGINGSQEIFQLLNGPTRSNQTLSLVPGSLEQISVGANGSVWGLSANTVEYFNAGAQAFQPVSGAPSLSQVAIGGPGDIWGVDVSGNIFRYDPMAATWNVIPGELNFIRVGADHSVWGINNFGQTYTWDYSRSGWMNIPGSLESLSVGADGTVWGINAQQQIYRFNPGTASWVNVPGSVKISVGSAANVWGVNVSNQVYRYNTVADPWTLIPNTSLADIAAAFDGSAWGVTPQGSLFEWNSTNQVFNAVSGGIVNVFAGSDASVWALNTAFAQVFSWFGPSSAPARPGTEPTVTLAAPAAGASQLFGSTTNADPSTMDVVFYALTNQWYVQPFVDAPFTKINADGSWSSSTNPWSTLVVLLVNPATYTPQATEITNPALDPGVLAWTQYPAGPGTLNFSGYTWGIKMTGNSPSDTFNPGPNFWSNDPSVVSVAPDGLHLKITNINGSWHVGSVSHPGTRLWNLYRTGEFASGSARPEHGRGPALYLSRRKSRTRQRIQRIGRPNSRSQ